MCGIALELRRPEDQIEYNTQLQELIRRRGPDAQCMVSALIGDGRQVLNIYSSVLHLRGPSTVIQPIQFSNGDWLCWNGEVYDGLLMSTSENDGEKMAQALENIMESSIDMNERLWLVCRLFEKLDAEYAFVFYHQQSETLFFGRDFMGRRSLVWKKHKVQWPWRISISSVQPIDSNGWSELPADGIYVLSMASTIDRCSLDQHLRLYKFTFTGCPMQSEPHIRLAIPYVNTCIGNRILHEIPSGGVSTLPTVNSLSSEWIESYDNFKILLFKALENRISNLLLNSDQQPPLAILFSGGIDCTVLAAIADKYLPATYPIDLLNVAFENPRILHAQSKDRDNQSQDNTYEVPDRKTGRQAHAELQALNPARQWSFVEINVPYDEAMAHKRDIIQLMAPLDTTMDLSIAMAFYFAARGSGVVNDKPYCTPARVLFSGLGADEQLGGYGRHRVKYKMGGWSGLVNEIALDVSRISSRNLGRDDRVVSHHGREVRFPFLAAPIVSFLSALPVHHKCDMRYDKGIGDKMLLRLVAHNLGLQRTALEEKRAVQFGSRTAKMDIGNRSLKGTMIVE